MSSLSDLSSALGMRNIIESMVNEMVNRIRPEEKIGKVYSYDTNSQTAKILFAGETVNSLVTARFSLDKQPVVQMQPLWESLGYAAPADIVRVSGRPGSYYILDFVAGYPKNWDGTEVGFGFIWFSNTLPSDKYLWCRGGSYSGSQYPVLASVLGDTFGTHSGDTYYLPDLNARSPIGAGFVASPGTGGNLYPLGFKWGHEQLQVHAHGVNDPTHTHVFSTGYSEFGGPHNWTFDNATGAGARNFNVQGSWGTAASSTGISIQNSGTGDKGNVHPVLGVNFIVRAK